ncbi:hypothetical protein ACIA8C_20630 [Nocardia sp. NPDC051321]|uniref:hypothetical protein n=1 Tax=Nocardia sp. NPDC051321 TaxID=3364323 RepID=UPI0037B226B5
MSSTSRRSMRVALATALLATSAVSYTVLVAPNSLAKPGSDDNKVHICNASAKLDLMKKGDHLLAKASKVDEPSGQDGECEVTAFDGEIKNVSYTVNGKMCELKSSEGSGDAKEEIPGGKEGDGTAKQAKVAISVPLVDGGNQGKYTVSFVSDPTSPLGSDSVEVHGTFPAKQLQLEKCDAASLPDKATVTVKGSAKLVPKDS